jgi:hypothetical protein
MRLLLDRPAMELCLSNDHHCSLRMLSSLHSLPCLPAKRGTR